MNPPRRLCGTIGMCNLREGFVNLREGFVVAPWRLREAFSKTRSAKASRRRHGRLHLETIRQIMTSHCAVRFTGAGRKEGGIISVLLHYYCINSNIFNLSVESEQDDAGRDCRTPVSLHQFLKHARTGTGKTFFIAS